LGSIVQFLLIESERLIKVQNRDRDRKALINWFSVRSAIYESIMQLLQFYEEAIADSLSKALHVLLLALYMLVSQSVSQKNLKNFTLSVFLSVYFI
jgi:hypothetical protein